MAIIYASFILYCCLPEILAKTHQPKVTQNESVSAITQYLLSSTGARPTSWSESTAASVYVPFVGGLQQAGQSFCLPARTYRLSRSRQQWSDQWCSSVYLADGVMELPSSHWPAYGAVGGQPVGPQLKWTLPATRNQGSQAQLCVM
jgi:hypothetical protein